MCIRYVCLLYVFCSLWLNAGQEDGKADWRMEIVPSRNSVGKGPVLYAKKPLDVFYVVLHNQSGKDLKLWREWCPWGYDNLSFVAELEDGGKVSLTRKPKKWGRAYPDAVLVKKGACYIYEVHLAGETWRGTGQLPNDKAVKLAVSFKVAETPESLKKKVWVGAVKSKSVSVTIRK